MMRLGEEASSRWMVRAVALAVGAVVAIYGVGLLAAVVFLPYRAVGQSVACQSGLFRQVRAFRMYADDYDDRFPPHPGWMDRILFYLETERRLHCPTVSRPGEPRYGYAMNTAASGRERGRIDDPDSTPLVYDSTDLRWSAADAFASLPHPGRHETRARRSAPSKRGNFVGYAGGNARFLPDAE